MNNISDYSQIFTCFYRRNLSGELVMGVLVCFIPSIKVTRDYKTVLVSFSWKKTKGKETN